MHSHYLKQSYGHHQIFATCGTSGTSGNNNAKSYLNDFETTYIWLWNIVFKEVLEHCHIAMCILPQVGHI